MKIAIVGSRNFTDMPRFIEAVDEILPMLLEGRLLTRVISGEAKGADTLAKNYAKANGIEYTGYPADWEAHGRAAGPIRNRIIVIEADAVIAFMGAGSKGTANVVQTAQKLGKRVIVVRVTPDALVEGYKKQPIEYYKLAS